MTSLVYKASSFNCVKYCGRSNHDCYLQSSESGRILKLTASDREKIQQSWKKISDHEKIGHEIFYHIFMIKPSLKRLWGLEEESSDTLASHPTFKKHARSFVTFLDLSVRSLSVDAEYLVKLARTIGKKHVSFRLDDYCKDSHRIRGLYEFL